MLFQNQLEFKICSINLVSELHLASSRNISQSGMCFRAASAPPLGSIIKIQTDLETLAKCIQIENMLFELKGCVLGKVIWASPAKEDASLTDVGVVFIKTGEIEVPDVKEAVSLVA